MSQAETKKPKSAKKAKKNQAGNKLSNVDREYYELQIADLDKKMARLRNNLVELEEKNETLTRTVEDLQCDREDIVAHLERKLRKRNESAKKTEEKLEMLTEEYENVKKSSERRIADLESKYKSMRMQLMAEIKMLSGKLNSLEEFRLQRENLMSRIEDLNKELQESQEKSQTALLEAEQLAVIEQNRIKKDVEGRLIEVSEDFMRSNEIRTAGYTRRLVRENFALQKEIEILIEAKLKMRQDIHDFKFRNKEMSQNYSCLQHTNDSLMKTTRQQVALIDKLTSKCEFLKSKFLEYSKFKEKYVELTNVTACERFEYQAVCQKLRRLGIEIERLNMENQQLLVSHKVKDLEIMRLGGILERIERAVQNAIDLNIGGAGKTVQEEQASSTSMQTNKSLPQDELSKTIMESGRKDLLNILMLILGMGADPRHHSVTTLPERSDRYHPGQLGFIKQNRQVSSMDIFATSIMKPSRATLLLLSRHGEEIRREDSLPQHVEQLNTSIVDVEDGQLYVVSSSRVNVKTKQPTREDEELLAYKIEHTSECTTSGAEGEAEDVDIEPSSAAATAASSTVMGDLDAFTGHSSSEGLPTALSFLKQNKRSLLALYEELDSA